MYLAPFDVLPPFVPHIKTLHYHIAILQLPGIFDVEFVSSQLRNSGILEAVQLIKDGYPIRIPLGQFVNR